MSNLLNPAHLVKRFFTEVSSHEMRATAGTVHAFPASTFQLEDTSDSTKSAVFSLSGLTTATERTITLPDRNMNLGSSAGVLRSVVDTGGVYATPIVLTADDSGKTYLLDDAAGLDFTLPAVTSSNVGMNFRFYINVEVTSNNYRFTAQAGDLLFGHILIVDKDAATGDTNALFSIFRPNGSSHLVLTITSADDTKGPLVGGWLEFEAITATGWFVRGSLVGDGSLATPFS